MLPPQGQGAQCRAGTAVAMIPGMGYAGLRNLPRGSLPDDECRGTWPVRVHLSEPLPSGQEFQKSDDGKDGCPLHEPHVLVLVIPIPLHRV